jgi:hypothetical protein
MRPERGNWGADYEASQARPQKSLQGQFGKFYDDKKIGNTEVATVEPRHPVAERSLGV